MATEEQAATPEPVTAPLDVSSAADALGGILDGLENPEDALVEEPKQEEPAEPEAKAEEEAEVESEQEPKEEETEPSSYTLAELAAAMEMSEDEFLASVKTTVKVDGKEIEVTLGESTRGYQRESDYSRKTMELAEQRKAIEAAKTTAEAHVAALQQVAAQQNALLQQTENQLTASYQAEDWATLRATDPAEFAAKQQEYKQYYDGIQQAKQVAISNYQQAEQQQKAYFQETVLPAEEKALRDAIPEWADESVMITEKREIAKYLIDVGNFKPEEVGELYDHRSAVLVRKAMLYDRQQQAAKSTKAKVREIPQVKNLKPGKRNTAAEQQRQQRTESLKRLRKSGSIDDAVAAMPDFD